MTYRIIARMYHPTIPYLASSLLFVLLSSAAAAQQDTQSLHLNLDQAIDLALKQNHSLHLRALSVEEMRNKKDEARSDYFPQLKANGEVLHVTELSGVEIPAGAFANTQSTGAVPAKTLFLGQGDPTAYGGGAALEQPLTQLLRIHQSNRAATQDISITQTQLDQAKDDVALQARQLYYDVLITQQKLQASLDQLEAAKVKATESQSDVERGNALEIANIRSQANILDVQQKSLTLRLLLGDFHRQLADLLGLPVHTKIELDSKINVPITDIPSRTDGVRLAKEQNPDLRGARQTLEKAKAGLAAAKDAYIPDLTALSKYSYQSGIPFLVHNFGTFGFALKYDLFDGGRRQAEIRAARTNVTSAQVNIDRLEEEVTVQVEAAYDKLEEVQQMVAVAEQSAKVRTEALRLTERQLEQNAALNSARSQAQADLASANASLLEANLDLYLAQADIKRTIGQMPR